MVFEKGKFYIAKGTFLPIYIAEIERPSRSIWIVHYTWPHESSEVIKWKITQIFVDSVVDKEYKEVYVSPVMKEFLFL